MSYKLLSIFLKFTVHKPYNFLVLTENIINNSDREIVIEKIKNSIPHQQWPLVRKQMARF